MSNKSEKNKFLRLELGNFCYLNGIITFKNPLTIHEIRPRRDNGKRIYINTALLCRLQHDKFNTLEIYKPKIAREVNENFHYIRETRDMLAVIQMGELVDKEIERLGYTVVDTGKILTLKRR